MQPSTVYSPQNNIYAYNIQIARALPPAPGITIVGEQDRRRFIIPIQDARRVILNPSTSEDGIVATNIQLFIQDLWFLFNSMILTQHRLVTMDTLKSLDNIAYIQHTFDGLSPREYTTMLLDGWEALITSEDFGATSLIITSTRTCLSY